MSRPISAAYLERKLRAVTGVERGNPLPDLESLGGLVVLENDRPEWRAVGGEGLAAGFGDQPAGGAGTWSQVALFNRLGSGKLAVVTAVRSSTSAAGSSRLRLAAGVDLATFGAPGTDVGRAYRDSRLGLTATGGLVLPALEIVALTSAAIAGFAFADILQHEYILTDQTIAVLFPGSGLNVQPPLQVTAQRVNFFWYERPIEGLFEVK